MQTLAVVPVFFQKIHEICNMDALKMQKDCKMSRMMHNGCIYDAHGIAWILKTCIIDAT